MKKDIIIANQPLLAEKIQKFKAAGKNKFHIVSDFDKTLTKAFWNGQKHPSVIAILREEKYLTPDYADRANALFEKYHPFEIDLTIPWETRKAKMLEWWMVHYDLLKECGLSKDDIEKVINAGRIKLRDNFQEFFEILDQNNIPLTIMTANGLGGDVIKMTLKKFNINNEDIYLVANEIIWDENNKFKDIKKPIVNVLNKDEIIIDDQNIQNRIKDKNNVILMGDSEGDLGMVGHIKYDNIIKIGYLNEKEDELKDKYAEIFDVVISHDQGLEPIINILKQIV